MKYRTKAILLLTLLSIFTNGVIASILYVKFRQMTFQQIQSKVLSIAATSALLVDGDLHEKIKSRSDESTDAYKTLEALLRRARDANRRDDVFAQYIYTMRLAPDNSDIIMFGVDAEESGKDKSHVGDVYKGKFGIPLDIEKNQVDQKWTEDKWGAWLSANAPIKDKSGQVVAAIGVDLKASDVINELNKVRTVIFIALAFSFGFALLVSLVLSDRVSKPLLVLRNALESIGKGNLEIVVDLKSNDEFGEVANSVNQMTEGLREREKVKSIFSRYVSHQVADDILAAGNLPNIKGNRRRITVLFSDIRGFTKMSENMPPEEVMDMLNEYFEKMIDVIFSNNGMLDKFMGDGMMVIFGAHQSDPEQEEHAIKTALEMKDALDKLCAEWENEGRTKISIGIGINSGEAVVGNIGSERRMQYTAIGNTVNLASRIETATKKMEADILISEHTFNAVKGQFKTKNMGPIQVRGRTGPLTVYSVTK